MIETEVSEHNEKEIKSSIYFIRNNLRTLLTINNSNGIESYDLSYINSRTNAQQFTIVSYKGVQNKLEYGIEFTYNQRNQLFEITIITTYITFTYVIEMYNNII